MPEGRVPTIARVPYADRVFVWIRRAAPHRLVWLGVPLLFYAWTLPGPFISDDYHMLLKTERYLRGASDELSLYRFAKTDEDWSRLRGRGTVPWWLHGRQDYLRPISEWSFCLDAMLFGRHPFGYRLVSLILFAVVLCVVHALYATASGGEARAGVATYFFGLSQTLAAPVSWISNRNDLLALLGVSVAAWAYWSTRTRPRSWQPCVAAAAFAFGILSKESAVALCPVLLGFEIIARRRRDSRWSQRLAGLTTLLVLAVAVGYLAYYWYSRPWAFGLSGSYGGQMQPGLNWLRSIMLYFSVWTCGFPIDSLYTAPGALTWAVALIGGGLAIVAAYFLRRSSRGDPAAVFFALWAVLFLLPGLRAVSASARIACCATVGWSFLLGILLVPRREEDVVLPRLLRHWFHNVSTIVNIGCIVGTLWLVRAMEADARGRIKEIVRTAEPPLVAGDVIVALRADSVLENICGGDRLEYLTNLPEVSLFFLLPVGVDADVIAEDDRTLLLRARESTLLGTPLHRLALPTDWSPRVGQRFEFPDFVIEVAGVRGDDFVSELRVRFREPMRSRRLHFHPRELADVARGR